MSIATKVYIANSEVYYITRGRKKFVTGSEPAILFHHGAGGETTIFEPQYHLANLGNVVKVLANAGFTVLSCDFGGAHTWGNTLNQSNITSAVSHLSTLGCRTDKIGLIGLSMGFTCTAKWAAAHASQVGALVGLMPAADAQFCFDNLPGEAAFMNAAYSPGNWAGNVATTNPSAPAIYNSLDTIPIRCYYATDDTAVGTTTSQNFCGYVNGAGGNATAIPIGTGGHFSDAPYGNIDTNSLAEFFNQYLNV